MPATCWNPWAAVGWEWIPFQLGTVSLHVNLSLSLFLYCLYCWAVLLQLHLRFTLGFILELISVLLARGTPKRAKQRGLLEPGLDPGPGQSRRPKARGQTGTRSWQGPPDTNEKPEARRHQRPEAGPQGAEVKGRARILQNG